eukprot:gene2518-biopygen2269
MALRWRAAAAVAEAGRGARLRRRRDGGDAVPDVSGVHGDARRGGGAPRRHPRRRRVVGDAAQPEAPVAYREGRAPPLRVGGARPREALEARPHPRVEVRERGGLCPELRHAGGEDELPEGRAVAQQPQRDLRVVEERDLLEEGLRLLDAVLRVRVAERGRPDGGAEQLEAPVGDQRDPVLIAGGTEGREQRAVERRCGAGGGDQLALAEVEVEPDLRREALQRREEARDCRVVAARPAVVKRRRGVALLPALLGRRVAIAAEGASVAVEEEMSCVTVAPLHPRAHPREVLPERAEEAVALDPLEGVAEVELHRHLPRRAGVALEPLPRCVHADLHTERHRNAELLRPQQVPRRVAVDGAEARRGEAA